MPTTPNDCRPRTGKRREHRTDLEPVREHLRTLMRSMRLVDIAQASGVPESSLQTVLYTSRSYCLTSTARAVLAVPVPAPHEVGARYVDATGTRRRLQALMRIGWPQRILAARLGRSIQAVSFLLQQPVVTRRTRDDVRALYRELAGQLGPSRTGQRATAVRAAARGFLGPAAWNDDTIDDPAALPTVDGEPADEPAPPYDELTVQLAVAGAFTAAQLDRAALVETVRRLVELGREDGEIAEQLRIRSRRPDNYVCKLRERAGIRRTAETSA